jgi:hypothetical protein
MFAKIDCITEKIKNEMNIHFFIVTPIPALHEKISPLLYVRGKVSGKMFLLISFFSPLFNAIGSIIINGSVYPMLPFTYPAVLFTENKEEENPGHDQSNGYKRKNAHEQG